MVNCETKKTADVYALTAQAEIDGVLIRPSNCETCKGTDPLIKHHRDYDKPLEVTWLCMSCHRKEHIANKELRNPNPGAPSTRIPEKAYIKLLRLRTKRRAKGERVSIGALVAEAVNKAF